MPGGSFLRCYEGAVQLRQVSGSRWVSDFNKRVTGDSVEMQTRAQQLPLGPSL